MVDRLDIIIFGATGFTGSRTIPQLVNILKNEHLNLTWGIAGRLVEKLKNVLNEVHQQTGELFNVPIITADVNDETSLIEMTSKARIIINTVGPYRTYGEAVVKACLETGTHYVDVSGEAIFQESIQLKYHEAALKNRVYLISSCGVGSIPTDLGVVYLDQNFKGTLNSVEIYSALTDEREFQTGPIGHVSSWESMLLELAHSYEKYKIRSKLLKTMPSGKVTPKLPNKLLHKCVANKKWAVPLPEPDRATINRSQKFFYQLYNQRPIQIETYMIFNKFWHVPLMIIFGVLVAFLAQFKFTRNLMIKYPKLFTLGMVSHEGPTNESQNKLLYEATLCGNGWPEKLTEPTDKFSTKPNNTITGRVSGRNPAYGLTCICLALCAITVVVEKDKLPNNGGCYPPGAAFAKTTLIQRLNRNGVNFQIVQT